MNHALLIIGLPEKDKEVFLQLKAAFKNSLELLFYKEPKDILIEKIKNHSLIYCYQRQDALILKDDLKYLKKILPGHLVNVILTTKDYDCLMTAYQRNVCQIIESPLSLKGLKKSYFKSSIFSEMGKNIDEVIPYTKLMSLFSTPEKLASNQELINYLNDYFRLFDGTRNFILCQKQKLKVIYSKKKLTTPELKKLSKEVQAYQSKKNTETAKVMNFNDDYKICLIKLPKAESKDELVLLVANKIKMKKIINNYFLKFLENVNLFRTSNLENTQLKTLALTDDITGLFNQRKLSLDLKEQILWHEKNHKKFCIMFIDVDHFKLVNDQWGHVVGSKMLIQIGDLLKKILRQTDSIYRYGGDEFVVIMPNADRENVYQIASRICAQVKEVEFKIDAKTIHRLSLSIGIGEFPTDAHSAHEIINFADVMMYKSKKAGRGKVFHINEVLS